LIIVKVPVKLYIKGFLENEYGQPCPMTRADNIGKHFYKLLEDHNQNHDSRYPGFPCVAELGITERVVLDQGSYLTKTNIIEFNNFMTEHIQAKWRDFIDTALRFKPSMEIKDAIAHFLQEYGLHQDNLPFETIKKDYYRYRCRTNGQLRLRKSVA
jgi:hypothetical protein